MADVQRLVITQTEEYLGGTSSQKVASCEVLTASGVLFEFRIPRADFTEAVARQEAAGYAAQVESILTDPNVAGIEYWPDPTVSGYLLDMGTITVQSDSGNSTLSFDVPWGHVVENVVSGTIAELAKELNAAEAPF